MESKRSVSTLRPEQRLKFITALCILNFTFPHQFTTAHFEGKNLGFARVFRMVSLSDVAFRQICSLPREDYVMMDVIVSPSRGVEMPCSTCACVVQTLNVFVLPLCSGESLLSSTLMTAEWVFVSFLIVNQ